uniref:Acyl-CoA_dh_1 domain-containing protein n=1 Tax=Steinernema glaseri TaxID=37863 RepID=A0A1I7YAP2_9BILA
MIRSGPKDRRFLHFMKTSFVRAKNLYKEIKITLKEMLNLCSYQVRGGVGQQSGYVAKEGRKEARKTLIKSLQRPSVVAFLGQQ